MSQNSSEKPKKEKQSFTSIQDLYPEGFKPYSFVRLDFYIALGVFFVSFVVYLLTLTPYICAGDSGELTTAIYNVGAAHPPGYPLYTMLGKIFTYIPVSTIAYRVNLLSAFFAALTIPFMFLFLLKLLRSSEKSVRLPIRDYLIAISCSMLLAFSQTMWSQAVIAEVYSLNIVFAPLLLLVVLIWQERVFMATQHGKVALAERFMLLFALLLGMSFTNHLLLAGYIFPFLAFFAVVFLYAHQFADKSKISSEVKIVILTFLLIAFGLAVYWIIAKAWNAKPLTKDVDNALYVLVAVFLPAIALGIASMFLMSKLPDKNDYHKLEKAKNILFGGFIAFTLLAALILIDNNVKQALNFFGGESWKFDVFIIVVYLCALAILGFSYFALRKQHSRLCFFTNSVTLIFKSYLVLLIPMLLYVTLLIRANAIAKIPDPPLSWGETANASRVLNHFLRKQYPKSAMRFSKVLPEMLYGWSGWHLRQFTPWLLLFVPFGLFAFYRKNRLWLGLSVMTFFFFNVLLLYFLSFKNTPRDLAFNEVFFIPSYVLVATWIAFGMQFVVKTVSALLVKESDDTGEQGAIANSAEEEV